MVNVLLTQTLEIQENGSSPQESGLCGTSVAFCRSSNDRVHLSVDANSFKCLCLVLLIRSGLESLTVDVLLRL